jgi:hypothetical protein
MLKSLSDFAIKTFNPDFGAELLQCMVDFEMRDEPEVQLMIDFLLDNQNDNGSW